MKRLFTLLITIYLLVSATGAKTPADSVMTPMKRPFILSAIYGRCINTGGNDNEYWFGRQNDNRGEFTIRATGMFSHHWGVFGEMTFGSGGEEWTPPIEGDWYYEVMCGNVFDTFGMGIGMMYRYEYKRWQLFARIGTGFCNIDGQAKYQLLDEESDEQTSDSYNSVLHAERFTRPVYVNFGITGGYRISRVCSVIFDVNYRYPYTSSKVYIIPELGNDTYEPKTYTSRSWGNNITFSIGVQLQCELSN